MNSCSKTELRKFKARAGRRQPAEYIETLWGFKTGRDHDIQAIRPVPHRGTRNLCQPGIDAWNQHIEEVAEATGMQFWARSIPTTARFTTKVHLPATICPPWKPANVSLRSTASAGCPQVV